MNQFTDRKDYSFRGSTRGHFQAVKVKDPTAVKAKEALEMINGCLDYQAVRNWLHLEKMGQNRKTVILALENRLKMLE